MPRAGRSRCSRAYRPTIAAQLEPALPLFGQLAERGLHLGPMAYMELRQPGRHRAPEPAGQARHVAEIDDVQGAARRQVRGRGPHGRLGVVDHRQAVGDRDVVEAAPVAEHGGRVQGFGDPVCQGRAHADALQLRGGDLQHRLGRVQAEEPSRRVALADQREVAAGAAADVQQRLAGLQIQLVDQPVAAEQVVFAGEVVDVLLRPVHPRHTLADVRRGRLQDGRHQPWCR